jgi:tetratricopeptide (TPR) repeat protein
MTGLELNADDLELLRLAGKSGVELAAEDAVSLLQRAVSLQPDDAESWHDLGEALAAEGRVQEATDAFRKAVDLRPEDPDALIDFGHSAHASGQHEEAVAALSKASELRPGDPATLRSLVGICREVGRSEQALAAAEQLADKDPEDVLAALDVAELNRELERHEDALAAYARLREIDDEPEHDVYALHGMVLVEMRREGWERALELCQEALRLDSSGRTEPLLGFFAGQVSGPRAHPASGRAEVDAALAASQAEHRRIHTEELAGF